MTSSTPAFPSLLASQEGKLLGIYAAMARDIGDALDLINECEDIPLLSGLALVLETPGGPTTDHELNALFAPIVRRRLAKLASPAVED